MAKVIQSLQGNHACALGAIAAGCRFYAGYPITPSSEIAERMALELPKVDGYFIQMEDELASMGAVLGASMGGTKAMTATSGPGFSLKQENLGYASAVEIPCVVANVMRGGPSTGMPTRPAQADIMQARWGSHGDHPVIVLTPDSVKEIHDQTIRAFDLAESLRVPVVVLFDEVLGHLQETFEIDLEKKENNVQRKKASKRTKNYQPYAITKDGVPPMSSPGDGHRSHTTGLTQAESGVPTQDPVVVDRNMMRLLGKLEKHREKIDAWEEVECSDAEVLIVSIGITARSAKSAVRNARRQGHKVGLFRPITLWPFPETALKKLLDGVHTLIVPEMNAGQLVLEIERFCNESIELKRLNRIDGEAIAPGDILKLIHQVL
ncbi:MAG: 2-oxoacid:acceptor oxidoreductase subunit alpha [SAR324 cluster bacterium]|nr:2-oxoacid:acceptor oxidoreductase subunit alpha [SAR324 cluster bacterium]